MLLFIVFVVLYFSIGIQFYSEIRRNNKNAINPLVLLVILLLWPACVLYTFFCKE